MHLVRRILIIRYCTHCVCTIAEKFYKKNRVMIVAKVVREIKILQRMLIASEIRWILRKEKKKKRKKYTSMEDFWKNFKNKWNEERERETHGKLVLDTSYVEERFNFLPQLPPRPSTNLQILPQISLHHDQSQTLLLQLLVILSRQVASDVGLHPGHDFAQSFVTELFHLTQHSGTEEYLLRFEHGPNRAKYLPLVSSIGLLLNLDHYFDYFFQNFPLPIVCIFINILSH